MSELPDLQSAVRGLDGVASAVVRWPDPQGPATLHVEFVAEADREAVTEAVLEEVRRYAGPQPENGSGGAVAAAGGNDRPAAAGGAEDAGPLPMVVMSDAAPPAPQLRTRPVFSGMTVDRGELDIAVEVTLSVGDQTHVGRAEGLATSGSVPRAAADATLIALRPLLPAGLRVQLDWLEVAAGTGPRRLDVVSSAVTCLSRRGEQVLIGSAIVHSDIREAAVRATLDALNRRLEQPA